MGAPGNADLAQAIAALGNELRAALQGLHRQVCDVTEIVTAGFARHEARYESVDRRLRRLERRHERRGRR